MITPFELDEYLKLKYKPEQYRSIVKVYIKFYKRKLEREKLKNKKIKKNFKKYIDEKIIVKFEH